MVNRIGLPLVAILLLLSLPPTWSQPSDSGQPASEEIRQYQERLRDMVRRFEEARELLRRQIDENQALRRENAELRQQLQDIREEREELEEMSEDERVATLRGRLREERELKEALIRKLKASLQENDRLQARLKKAEGAQFTVQDDFIDILEFREEQRLFQLGSGFSPSGYMNGIFLVNIPQTPLGLFAETNYHFREKDWDYSVGVQFRFGRFTEVLRFLTPEEESPIPR
jgi:sugar-specific transcriptional regulator TrmB